MKTAAGSWGCSKGFTMVELLVVIAIISVLASLLLPVLQNSREQVYGVSCLSNQKQIGMAISYYIDDYNGYFMGSRTHGKTWMFLVNEILENKEILDCPARERLVNKELECEYGWNYSGYSASLPAKWGMGSLYPEPDPMLRRGALVKAGKLPDPSGTLLVSEQREYNEDAGGNCLIGPGLGDVTTLPKTVHLDGANLLYADFHASRMEDYALVDSGNLPMWSKARD